MIQLYHDIKSSVGIIFHSLRPWLAIEIDQKDTKITISASSSGNLQNLEVDKYFYHHPLPPPLDPVFTIITVNTSMV